MSGSRLRTARHPEPFAARESAYHPGPAPVPVLQRAWELDQLLTIYRERRPRRVLEIGTFHGGTLYHWLRNAEPGALVVTVDTYAAGVDNRHLYPEWVPEGVSLEVIAGSSHDPAVIDQAGAFGPYDFIVIDADHMEPAVRRDWESYSAMAARGGVIALHDILRHPSIAWIQVEPVWRDIQRMGYVCQELIADPSLEWGGWGVVYLPGGAA